MNTAIPGLPREHRDRVERAEPGFARPMLATLTRDHFSDPGWIFERKLDGERCLAVGRGGTVTLYSRNEQELNRTYPELVSALEEQGPDDFAADGEVVAFRGAVTSFQRLQERMQVRDAGEARNSSVAVYYYLFDLTVFGAASLEALPLSTRKQVLKRAFDFDDPLRYTPHRNERGEEYLAEACRKGWEGLIAKRRDSAYVHARSRHWLKFKCSARQELVVGGFTEPQGERDGFGALLMGYYDGGAFTYAGKVGTGFDDQTLKELRGRLDSLTRETTPFDAGDPPQGRDNVHWVTPSLVAEVGFTEWTRAGRLRHPRFLGLRRDKDPEDVVREDAGEDKGGSS